MYKVVGSFWLAVFTLVAGEVDMKPFPMKIAEGAGSLADVSFLLERPAGKDGFVRVKDGHFVKPNGERFRVWGTNLVAANATPAKEDAPIIAAYLARFGLNAIRFHFLHRIAPAGLIDAGRNDTRALDPAQMDRFDFFVAELKKQGIYTNLNLNVGRMYKAGDGVRDFELLGYAKALTYFDEKLLTLQREYAKQLLTHYNPYTKAEYRNEPAVLMIEFVNENSIVESWVSGRLAGKQTRQNPGTWSDIPASYAEDLTKKYNQWLARKLTPADLKEMGAPVARLAGKKELETAPLKRYRMELAFYMELEDNFFQSMSKYLKEDLQVKPLVAGTSDHNHGISGYPLLHSTSKLDIVDGHTYWQHPSYIEDPATGKRTGFTIGNSAMVNDPYSSSVVELSRSAVAGKPYTVSEVNHPFPSEYASEGIPILGAYASLQDWDGIFWYCFGGSSPAKSQRALSYFDISPDPVKMTQLATGALMFLRHDVATAGRTITRAYSTEEVYDSLRMSRAERPFFTPGFPISIPLEHQVRIAGFDGQGPTRRPMERANQNPIVSDTNQLAWQTSPEKTGIVTVDTKRYQAIVGYLKAERKDPANLAASVKNNFGAITLASLDGAPLSRCGKMLLTVGSRVQNTNQQWNDKRNSLVDWGTAPALIEPVAGTVTLKGLETTAKVEAVALDAAGKALGQPVAARKTPAGWEFPIGATATTWYAIRVAR